MINPARGRFETAPTDEGWRTNPDGSRTVVVALGDEVDSPAVTPYEVPPGFTAPPHRHDSHYASVILRGSLRVGRRWYGPGDIRFQERGSVYGPEEAGAEGCLMLNIFADQRGMAPWLATEADPPERRITPDLVLRATWSRGAEER